MNKKFAIYHVNNDHIDALILIYKKHINNKFKTIKLHDYNLEHLVLMVDEKKQLIPFPKKMKNLGEFKDVFIAMYQDAKAGFDATAVKEKMRAFMQSYKSVILSTLLNKKPVLSYAFLMTHKQKFYIYISAVAEHYWAIKQNPNVIKVMWLEDESKAPSPINRKRAIFNARARFVADKEEKNVVFNSYIKKSGSDGGISMIKNMEDFFLIELQLEDGRYVQGFGQAYNIKKDGSIQTLNNHQIHKH